MVSIVGRYNGTSKSGKPFAVLAITYPKDGVTGQMAESIPMSVEYADKLESYYKSGGELVRGWSKKDNRPFVFIPSK